MFDPRSASSAITQLETRLGCAWRSIAKARDDTRTRRKELDDLFIRRNSPDTSLVVFGSVARQEVTAASDLDWILLIDGQSVPDHKEQEREIEHNLREGQFITPGRSGIFGKMVGSHDLVHNIGGEDDLNSNTTRRVLLLLESIPIGDGEAYSRVRRQIVRRYLEDDRGLTHGESKTRIPRFLLNDITRYWRTVTVDFVYKQRAKNDEKWALRNAKLRMSRKLIFAAGLALVFFCDLDKDEEATVARIALKDKRDCTLLTSYIEKLLAITPLEMLARMSLLPDVNNDTIHKIFNSYDAFLGILDNSEKRSDLERARTHEDLRRSAVWSEIRAVSRPFHDGLVSLFLNDNEDLKQLTMTYGVF